MSLALAQPPVGDSLLGRPARPRRAFILLEVMLAILIIGVSMIALMRGFILSMDQISNIRDNEVAMLLGKSLLDDMILEPPGEGEYEGNFGEDPRWGEGFADWYWTVEVESEEPDYDERPDGTLFQELEHLYYAEVVVTKEERRGRREFLRLHTILLEPDIFSPQAIEKNQLF